MTRRVLQLGNTETGEYDVREALPYPYRVNEDGTIDRQDFWQGSPYALLGFQRGDVQEVVVLAEDWLRDGVDVSGLRPVFTDAGGTVWAHRYAVVLPEGQDA